MRNCGKHKLHLQTCIWLQQLPPAFCTANAYDHKFYDCTNLRKIKRMKCSFGVAAGPEHLTHYILADWRRGLDNRWTCSNGHCDAHVISQPVTARATPPAGAPPLSRRHKVAMGSSFKPTEHREAGSRPRRLSVAGRGGGKGWLAGKLGPRNT